MLCSQLCQLLLYLSVAGRFADGCLHLVQQIALVEFVHTYLDVAHAGDVISVGDCVEDGGPSSVFGQKGRVDHNQAVREEVDELFGQHVAIGAYNPEIGLGHGTGQTAPLLLPLLLMGDDHARLLALQYPSTSFAAFFCSGGLAVITVRLG